jgi:hypothetical protein
MILASVLGLLALFSFLSILLSGDDSEPQVASQDKLPVWALYGKR